jgi:ribosomal protein S25
MGDSTATEPQQQQQQQQQQKKGGRKESQTKTRKVTLISQTIQHRSLTRDTIKRHRFWTWKSMSTKKSTSNTMEVVKVGNILF